MKRKLAITAIVVLAIGFVGLAGGFTKLAGGFTKSESRSETTCVNPDDPLGILSAEPWAKYLDWEKMTEDEWCYTREVKREVFDPRSTAMFVIGGAIIGLLPLARQRR